MSIFQLKLDNKVPPPVVATLIAVTMWGLSAYEPALFLSAKTTETLVLLLVIVGVSFDVCGLLAFRQSKTTINPMSPDKTTALVTGGIYRLSRNPMYVGLALFLTAWAIQLSMLWPFIGPVLFVIYINRFQIAPEERVMEAKFGDEYLVYKNKVRRWL
ncbi:MAG: protein-S-isoprenylcysteine O-methyltransferase Ste14 [Gammaproteobacteria bacterium]|jgi:protein-S-isoprenylcysteine O-methyltransferase Ste14